MSTARVTCGDLTFKVSAGQFTGHRGVQNVILGPDMESIRAGLPPRWEPDAVLKTAGVMTWAGEFDGPVEQMYLLWDRSMAREKFRVETDRLVSDGCVLLSLKEDTKDPGRAHCEFSCDVVNPKPQGGFSISGSVRGS